ncbi:MAG: DUF4175 family protein, partial [Pseudomonadota bacterium]
MGAESARSTALWDAHQRRVAEAAAAARAPAPDLRAAQGTDPYALRYFAGLAVGAAILIGSGGGRLDQALAPIALPFTTPPTPMTMEMWATPPDYTGVAP